MGRELLHVLGRFHGEVVAHAGGDQHLLDALQRARAPVQADERRMIGVQVRTDARIDARGAPAGGFDGGALAVQAVHVRRGAAQVRHHPGESRNGIADGLDLADHRILGAALNDASFVLGDRAERAAAEAAALNRDREANHVIRRDARGAIFRMRPARIGQLVNGVHFLRGQRERRRIEPNLLGAVALHERAGIARVRLQVQNSRCVRIQHRIGAHRLERGQTDDAALARGVRHLAKELDHPMTLGRRRRRRAGWLKRSASSA